MKAMQVNGEDRTPILIPAELSTPEPGEGELLIRVHAAGVTPSELLWHPTTHTKDGQARLRAVPGHEFSGIVAKLGKHVGGFELGQAIFGMNDWFADGATAEFCLAQPQDIAAKPATLTHELSATVPIGALTAWQGLLDRAKLQPGERVLVHGAAGSVGLFAVQLAHLHGARVIATASAQNIEFVRSLGADEVIDYKKVRFEEEIADKVHVIFDAIGGETLDRSWSILKTSGRMITIAADAETTTEQRIKDAFFIVEPNQKQLVEIAHLLDTGKLKTFLKAAVPLEDASAAYSRTLQATHSYGKVVITIPA
jgi:NADPH:quinone reductase-like Zn-dependent oxidoreductase